MSHNTETAANGKSFMCHSDNPHAAALALADWLEQSGLIRHDVRKANMSVLINITPRQDGRCKEKLASIDLLGRIETRISEQATRTLRALIAERSTPDAAKAIEGRIVIMTAVSLLAGRVAEQTIKTLAGMAAA